MRHSLPFSPASRGLSGLRGVFACLALLSLLLRPGATLRAQDTSDAPTTVESSAADEAKQDEAKKDEAKKDDAKKDDAKQDDAKVATEKAAAAAQAAADAVKAAAEKAVVSAEVSGEVDPKAAKGLIELLQNRRNRAQPPVVDAVAVEDVEHGESPGDEPPEGEAKDVGPKEGATPIPPPKAEPKPPMFYMRDATRLAGFPDLTQLHVETAYGPLVIPIAEVQHVRFALSTDNALAETVAKLIAQLGSEEFDLREEAQEKLLEIGTPALAAVQAATESEDEEIKARAEKLVSQLEEEVEEPEEEEIHLAPLDGDEDEISTHQFVVRGKVMEQSFAVKTLYGDLEFRREDILSIVFQEPLISKEKVSVAGTQFAGNNRWVDSEVELAAGAAFKVEATGTLVLRNFGNQNCGPSGTTNFPSTFNDFPCGALVAKVGDSGTPFLVGASYEGTTKEAGRLLLGIAMKSGSVTGSYEVVIEKPNE